MKKTRMLGSGMAVAALAALLAASWTDTSAGQGTADAVRIDPDDVGGVVTGPKGPEAGVWVIAETTDLPTKFARIVVTDDRGRYLLPDLPKANYAVWVRGYGLVDSPKSQTVPGKVVNLTAVVAPDARAAAQYYPAAQWLSLLRVPDKSEFPGTGPSGNGISENVKSQAQWLRQLKSGGCTACHQLGNKATRELPPGLGHFDSTAAAWERRVQSGQAGSQMLNGMNQFGAKRAFALFADWTDRIAAGEVPPAPPTAARHRAQRRHHPMGLGGPEVVSARRRLDRSAQSDGQRERARLRRARAQQRLPPRSGSRATHDEPGRVDGARSEDAADGSDDAAAVAVLGP